MPHLFDRVAGLALTIPNPGTVIFPEGWGESDGVDAFTRLGQTARPASVDIEWQPKTEHRGYRRRRGSFASPIADLLPHDARLVSVELTEPAASSDRLVVLLPSWNDEGFESRRLFAEALAGLGVAALAADIPLYGRRRRRGSSGMPIRTVADFGVMGLGAIVEAEALVNALSGTYGLIGVGGFSMGGNLAALVSARSVRPLATGLMAASHSPGPIYLEGTLRHAISWRALGGKGARPRLADMLGTVSVLSLPRRAHHGAAVAVAARSDGFVPPSAPAALARHWTGSELRWLAGGHATLWRKNRGALVDAIVDSFDRLET